MAAKQAVIYRMVMPEHLCPFGLKAKDLLQRAGYRVEDHWLTTRAETDAFQRREGVETTPQVWIGDKRVGGYDEVRDALGKGSATSSRYRPVLTVFAIAFLLALATSLLTFATPFSLRVIESFFAISMTLLAMLKLQDVESFSNMFLGYDLLAQRWVPYAYLYPYGEALAGLLMLAGVLTWVSSPIALLLGGIGAISVFKAVYVDKRDLTCACVGGGSKVPLGFISLTENLVMVGMALWMLGKQVV